MTRDEATEAAGIIGRALDLLLGAAPAAAKPGQAGAALRAAVGQLRTDAEARLRAANIGASLLYSFELARLSGASMDGLRRVREGAEAETPIGLPAQIVAALLVRLALSQEAKILAAAMFSSRNEVDAVMARMREAFDAAEEYASEELQPDVMRALVRLAGAVTDDLARRARLLPRVIEFDLAQPLPSLFLAQRLYADPSREGELVAENRTRHPLFTGGKVRALSK
jgi:prophage DNA circulation protein